jgi:Golgi nucleoside diphosphatase
VPALLHPTTPIYILATAGLRMISVDAQEAIIRDISAQLLRDYKFHFVPGRNIEIISGQMEGVAKAGAGA